jgi:hypothetical protein
VTVFITKINEDGECIVTPHFEGATLYDRERNGYHDSDFYALVWDEEKGEVRDIEYGTTRFANTPRHAPVDATKEVWEKAWQWAEEKWLERIRYEANKEANEVAVGRQVRVARGRKVPIGTEGKVLWMDAQTWSPRYRNGYKRGPDCVAVGIATTDRTEEVGTWEITLDGHGLAVKAPYDNDFINKCRKWGGKWDRVYKLWRFRNRTNALKDDIADACTEFFPPKLKYLDVAKTYAKNLEVIDPQVPTEEELREKAKAKRHSILTLFTTPGYVLMA